MKTYNLDEVVEESTKGKYIDGWVKAKTANYLIRQLQTSRDCAVRMQNAAQDDIKELKFEIAGLREEIKDLMWQIDACEESTKW